MFNTTNKDICSQYHSPWIPLTNYSSIFIAQFQLTEFVKPVSTWDLLGLSLFWKIFLKLVRLFWVLKKIFSEILLTYWKFSIKILGYLGQFWKYEKHVASSALIYALFPQLPLQLFSRFMVAWRPYKKWLTMTDPRWSHTILSKHENTKCNNKLYSPCFINTNPRTLIPPYPNQTKKYENQ